MYMRSSFLAPLTPTYEKNIIRVRLQVFGFADILLIATYTCEEDGSQNEALYLIETPFNTFANRADQDQAAKS